MAKTPDKPAKKPKPPTLQVATTEETLTAFRIATLQRGTDMTKAVNAFMREYVSHVADPAPGGKVKRK